MRLKLERFGLPNKPSGTPAHRRWVGAESENKPTATPERPKGAFRCEGGSWLPQQTEGGCRFSPKGLAFFERTRGKFSLGATLPSDVLRLPLLHALPSRELFGASLL